MTAVHIETIASPVLYLPGPNAVKVGHALDRIRALATEALHARRYCDDAELDPLKLEVLADALHAATRPMRYAERAHVQAWTAEVQAREMGMDTGAHDTEEPDDEPSPELES